MIGHRLGAVADW